ncbi:UDP-N-acetylglucosamine 2-epimerase [Oleiphilus messinensis]|uniref:UDP-N-acetylglucosamine 2-epimerase n=1 Tax=Oleiphilus messinensis TaxID=141451 RepID=A0A1Y0I9U6_9GAMM|nr:UDP-N-acetylglucosamine 2-epimerase (non-hydrolyzing) [Oleiphilus messinensis]ARU56163.1 UDP-N-acetylglucosamine 2-epimerase [Oleiphilus messinensis]
MKSQQFKVLCIVGARPNFMKIAPIIEAFSEYPDVTTTLLHTGQHYDHAMKSLLFDQLGLPVPDIDLEVRGGTHAEQTANIMLRFEPVLDDLKPDTVLVVGDVNSTIACALVAVKKHIPVIHVEAGLRSGDMDMPEEVNRVLTDQISSLLYTTEKLGNENLGKEGIAAEKVRFAGNVMIDTLLKNRAIAPELTTVIDTYGLEAVQPALDRVDGRYVFLTMHRPSNVDDPAILEELLLAIADIARQTPVIFAVHPRTKGNIEKFNLGHLLQSDGIFTTEPVGYLDSITLMANALLVLTDSGGIQEETTALGVPCITMRHNTERWITVTEGTNTIVGTDSAKIKSEYQAIIDGKGKAGRQPELWDGQAAKRIAADIREWLVSNAAS